MEDRPFHAYTTTHFSRQAPLIPDVPRVLRISRTNSRVHPIPECYEHEASHPLESTYLQQSLIER
jgi:hypothetical protein